MAGGGQNTSRGGEAGSKLSTYTSMFCCPALYLPLRKDSASQELVQDNALLLSHEDGTAPSE